MGKERGPRRRLPSPSSESTLLSVLPSMLPPDSRLSSQLPQAPASREASVLLSRPETSMLPRLCRLAWLWTDAAPSAASELASMAPGGGSVAAAAVPCAVAGPVPLQEAGAGQGSSSKGVAGAPAPAVCASHFVAADAVLARPAQVQLLNVPGTLSGAPTIQS